MEDLQAPLESCMRALVRLAQGSGEESTVSSNCMPDCNLPCLAPWQQLHSCVESQNENPRDR